MPDEKVTASQIADPADVFLTAAEQREQAATPGPWVLETDSSDDETADDHPWPYAIVMPEPNHTPADRSLRDFDFKYTELAELTIPTAEFIVAARSDVPLLLRAVRAVLGLCCDTDGEYLPPQSELPVGEFLAAITGALTGKASTDG